MIIGIISDTHDNKDSIMKAVDKLNQLGIKYLIHAGDHIAPFTVRWMSKFNGKVYGVAGNNDGEIQILKKLYEDNGWVFRELLLTLELEGKKMVVTHGTYPELVDLLVKSEKYDIVIYGHTHEYKTEKVGRTLVINPGEACGYLTGKRTMAILNMRNMDVKILDL